MVLVVLPQLQAPALLTAVVAVAAAATQAALVALRLLAELVDRVAAETVDPPHGMLQLPHVPQAEAETELPIRVAVVVVVAIAITTTQEIRKVVAVPAVPESL